MAEFKCGYCGERFAGAAIAQAHANGCAAQPSPASLGATTGLIYACTACGAVFANAEAVQTHTTQCPERKRAPYVAQIERTP
ncbi:hypothetical protein [Candidatus Chloroploca asiatica]|uniref:C2H2-type domain-containing protein n=1 Tax=Candidatus Chloroploca asiatica TaxID=1506545 RepID=A0A2H3KIW5_9CHLR|nr:hypothetical protein [Candidatus Chloroploca asiatica]PDV97803.1 hypothetical protein A9Q02_17605 [Candidatus Chloroploca asiatica]